MKAVVVTSMLMGLLFAGCGAGETNNHAGTRVKNPFVRVEGKNFLDPEGRRLTLHGINVINKDSATAYVCAIPEDVYRKMKQWGFNVVRLGILWDGLEPVPGKYDEKMFECIDRNIGWAKKYGIYVVLDMHQDLYSVKYSDGAPRWATLDEGKPHLTGTIWSDAYLLSDAIQTAFDNFWNNTPAPDGVGIQDHYAALWKRIAARYADEPVVIGYDLMNEPFPGSQAGKYVESMITAYGQWLAATTGRVLPAGKLMAMWNSPEGKMKVFATLRDTSVYRRILFPVRPLTRRFEEGPLNDMYSRVGRAIREVDTNHILFLEHNYFCNPGVPSALMIPTTGKNGEKDRKVAYAPHGYDLLVDTKGYEHASMARVSFLFEQVRKTADRLHLPVLVGEWGAFHSRKPVFTGQTEMIIRSFAGMGFSETFWAYFDGIETYPFFSVLQHPYPVVVAGETDHYSFDLRKKEFTATWFEKSSIKAPSLFYIPGVAPGDAVEVELSPEGKGFSLRFTEKGTGAILAVTSTGKEEKREMIFRY